LKNDGGRKKKKLGICSARVGHGRATTGTGRANLLVFGWFGKAWDGTAVPLQARAVPLQARAVPLQARAVPLQARAVPLQARAVPIFWHFGAQNFFSPFS